MSSIVKYGLYHTGYKELLGFSTCQGGEEFCVDVEYELSTCEENVWLVDSKEKAEEARTTNPEWYNRSYSTPENSFNKEDLKVVKIKIEFEECEE